MPTGRAILRPREMGDLMEWLRNHPDHSTFADFDLWCFEYRKVWVSFNASQETPAAAKENAGSRLGQFSRKLGKHFFRNFFRPSTVRLPYRRFQQLLEVPAAAAS